MHVSVKYHSKGNNSTDVNQETGQIIKECDTYTIEKKKIYCSKYRGREKKSRTEFKQRARSSNCVLIIWKWRINGIRVLVVGGGENGVWSS